MKTAEELKALKEELDSLKKKLSELTTEEYNQVTAGVDFNGSIFTYTVAERDSLGQIAQKFHVGVQEICLLNAIANPDTLKVGQLLMIPYRR